MVTDSSRPPAPMLSERDAAIVRLLLSEAGIRRRRPSWDVRRRPSAARRPPPSLALIVPLQPPSPGRRLRGFSALTRFCSASLPASGIARSFLACIRSRLISCSTNMRELAVAGIGEEHAVVLAQQPLLAGDVGPIGRVVAASSAKWACDVDELGAVEIRLLADDVVHGLGGLVLLRAAHDGLADPVDGDAAPLQRLDEAVDPPPVFVAPVVRAPAREIARRGADMVAVGDADHDDADVEGLAAGLLPRPSSRHRTRAASGRRARDACATPARGCRRQEPRPAR